MRIYLLRMARLCCIAYGMILSISGFAQHAPAMPFEDVGVVRSIDPSRSMITVGERTLRVTSATLVTADDPALHFSTVAPVWLGRQIGMETERGQDGVENVVRLHFF